jgi:HPt (histidine-containing phosphotransfer) domain-containing protein
MTAAVDRGRIEAVCGGDDGLAVELIAMLVDDAALIVDALGTCLQTNDIAVANDLAHSLKGIAGNVGAAELRDAAARLQTATAPDAAPPHALLVEEVAAIAAALERVRGTLDSWQVRVAGNIGIFAP